jgi:hypothetical protein
VADDGDMLRTLLLGTAGSVAGTIYGTIVVLSTLAAGAEAFRDDLWHLVGIVAATVLVLWLAHVYSDGIGESLEEGRRLTTRELAAIAGREFSIPLASVLPVAALVLGAFGVLGPIASTWLAFGLGLATLAGAGLRYAMLERLSRAGTLVSVLLNLSLGVALGLLKAFVGH